MSNYASEYYGVPADIGRRVVVDGKPGIIAADRGHYIGVNFDAHKPGARMHRLVLGNIAAGLVIDHINGNKLDNRRANLRAVPQNVNSKNRRHPGRGISQTKNGRWEAYVWDRNRKIGLGLFVSESQAAAVAKAKRDELMSLYGV